MSKLYAAVIAALLIVPAAHAQEAKNAPAPAKMSAADIKSTLDAAAADPAGTYRVLSYADLEAGTHDLGGGFDAIVFNYALFEEDVTPLLGAVRRLLAPRGAVLIQTLHPDVFAGAAEGWRIEDFAAFESRDWTPMPWGC